MAAARRKAATTRRKAAGKATARRKRQAQRKRAQTRKRLRPRKEPRGLTSDEMLLDVEDAAFGDLVTRVREAGGVALGAYREPLSGHPLLLASLPLASIEPTPFQRELSPTHTKRLAEKIEEAGAFLDPLIVVQGPGGELWTPNGRHRLAAARLLGMRVVTALVSGDEHLAFRILALNTEKAHNLRDRSLEAIRMARALARRRGSREADFAAELESPALLTLGIVYERERRFAGGAYQPFLRRVDRFSTAPLARSLRQREGWAARLLAIDVQVKAIVEALRERGMRSPYLRNYVVARINPVRARPGQRGKRETTMAIGAALTRMAAAARRFDPASVRDRDLALVAAVAPEEPA